MHVANWLIDLKFLVQLVQNAWLDLKILPNDPNNEFGLGLGQVPVVGFMMDRPRDKSIIGLSQPEIFSGPIIWAKPDPDNLMPGIRVDLKPA